jgi:colicin import membrane protein
MSERRSDRYLSIFLSVLVHAAIAGALLWGWWRLRTPAPPPQTLAIEATVVQNQPPATAPPASTPAQSPPTPAQPPPPQPDAAAEAEREQALEQQRADDKRKAEARAEEQRAADEQARQQREREAQEEAERKVKEEAERHAKEEADRKAAAQAEAQRKAQELAQRKAEQERAQRESELQSQLAAEEHLNAARASGEQAQYIALLRARIEHAWIRPASAQTGIDCEVHVTQIPGGEVTGVQVGSCNGDAAVRQSIEAAVYRASPLPAPPDPALFERNLTLNFKPND